MAALYSKNDEKRALDIPPRPGFTRERYRTPWRRDYARLIHSAAFRRLQGKTQLFPTVESDFFRNRLTHSLEVAQIAKSIAIRLNNTNKFFRDSQIDTDLVETAALAHDLGHPPFGHNGEAALDYCMKGFGGFEGNAQTLRILARLEKRQTKDPSHIGVDHNRNDVRAGLNLTYRTLAAVLKYDQEIPVVRKSGDKIVKGYYYTEARLVRDIKKTILKGRKITSKFRTIECSIMDIADDIAYSTYDLEDSFQAGFTSPLDMIASSSEVLDRVGRKVSESIERPFQRGEVVSVLLSHFGDIFKLPEQNIDLSIPRHRAYYVARCSGVSENIASNDYSRTAVTSELVDEFIRSVRVKVCKDFLTLSIAYLPLKTRKSVEVLKNYTYENLIMSPRLKIAEHRGYEIVNTIFQALDHDEGYLLLPEDLRLMYLRLGDEAQKKRTICDFIGGMTDRYAVEFYGRLRTEDAQTIFKPLTY